MEPSSGQNSEQSISSLIGGIINDAKDLLIHEFTIAKLEIQSELTRAKSATLSYALGAGITVAGGFLLILMLVHVLHTYTTLSLWGCYGIIGVGLLIIGLLILRASSRKVEQINLVPTQSIEILRTITQGADN